MAQIRKKEYGVLRGLRADGYSDELIESVSNALHNVAEQYSGDIYICDAILEQADSCVPVWNKAVLDQAGDLEEYVGEVIREGLIDLSRNKFSLVNLMRVAWYEFIQENVYQEVSTIAFNYMADLLNDGDAELNGDVSALEESLWRVAENVSADAQYYELEESAACELAVWLGKEIQDMRNPVKTINELKGNTD